MVSVLFDNVPRKSPTMRTSGKTIDPFDASEITPVRSIEELCRAKEIVPSFSVGIEAQLVSVADHVVGGIFPAFGLKHSAVEGDGVVDARASSTAVNRENLAISRIKVDAAPGTG